MGCEEQRPHSEYELCWAWRPDAGAGPEGRLQQGRNSDRRGGECEAEAQPVFPASDPHVIAVTATDSEDRIFQGANRAAHVDLAAPGVEILVPAPAGEYQIMTGTSVAAAHVSGVVALMLERSPLLTPTEVRSILVQSARPIGPPAQLGAGLVDARNALRLSIRRSATPLLTKRANTLTTVARVFADHIAELGTVLGMDGIERDNRAIAIIDEEGTEVYRAPLKGARSGRH